MPVHDHPLALGRLTNDVVDGVVVVVGLGQPVHLRADVLAAPAALAEGQIDERGVTVRPFLVVARLRGSAYEAARAEAHRLAERLRDRWPGLALIVHAGGGSFKSQMRKADKSGARIALILGESEIEAGTVSVKYLREQRQQVEVPQAEIVARMSSLLQ